MTLSFVAACMRDLAATPARFALLVLALLLEAAYYLGSPLLYKVIFDDGITRGQAGPLLLAVLALGALLAGLGLATFAQERLAGALGVAAMNRLRARLFAKVQAMAPQDLAARPQGEVGQLFGADVAALELALVRAVPPLMLHGVVIAASLVLLAAINWILFLVTLAALPGAVLLPKLFSGRAAQWDTRHGEARGQAAGFVQENLANAAVVRLFDLGRQRAQGFAFHLRHMGDSGPLAYMFAGLVARTAFLGTGIAQLVVIGVGALLALQGQMTAGLLVAYVGLLMSIAEAVSMLSTAIPLLLAGAQARGRLSAFLAQPVAPLQDETAQAVGRLSGAIAFAGIGFSYGGARAALDDLSFQVAPGQRVALVGPSGCGKSTALALLTRFATAQSGQVLLDGRPITAITEESLRANMAVVPQSAPLFDATIAENILLGRPGASREDMIAAARAAGIHDAIVAKPQGYDTVLTNGTGALSGGERQRVALARALLRAAPILVLDEATSALDPASEHVVNASVAALGGSCTVVSVTHRLASVVDYDQILVLRDGKLAEAGRHDELVAAGGLYAGLWSRQQGMNVTPSDETGPVITPERLALIPFLSECARDTLEELAGLFVSSHFSEGQYVFHHGDAGDRFYLVARGGLQVRLPAGGGERVVATLHDGDFFGELALLRDAPRAASILAHEDSWCLSLSRPHFLRIIQAEPGMRARIDDAVRKVVGDDSAATP